MDTIYKKGASYFWIFALSMPVEGNPIVAWKFCYLLHRVLRDGHPNVLNESQKYKSKLADVGKLWVFIKLNSQQ